MTVAQWWAAKVTKKPTTPPKLPDVPLVEDPEDEQEDETQDQRDERRRFLVLWFRGNLRDPVDHRVEQLTEHLAEGEIDSQAWATSFRKLLSDAHGEAHTIGRRLAGSLGPFDADDVAGGVAAWERPETFFSGFLADLEGGRYTKNGALLEAQFNARARQYVSALRGTLQESFRLALGDDLTDWNLTSSEHCNPSPDFPYSCPALAKESPKPANEWPTAPGRGDCPCRGECRCFLSTTDGKYSTEGV